MVRTLALSVALALGGAGWASAQETGAEFVACPSQQEIEQYLASDRELLPEACRTVSVTTLASDGRRLCVADISGEGDSLLGSIADAAVPTQWWADCEDASALLR